VAEQPNVPKKYPSRARTGEQILQVATHRVGHPGGPASLWFHGEVGLNESRGAFSVPVTADMVSPGLKSHSRLSKPRRLSSAMQHPEEVPLQTFKIKDPSQCGRSENLGHR